MDTKGIDLEPCPFCGSRKLKVDSKTKNEYNIRLKRSVANRTYSMRCKNCHARGGTVSGKVIPFGVILPDDMVKDFTTEEKLEEACIRKWNTRV